MIRPFSFIVALGLAHLCSCSADDPASRRAADGTKDDRNGGAGGSATTAGNAHTNPVGNGGNDSATDRSSTGGASAGTSPELGNVVASDSGAPAASATGFQNLAVHNCYQAGCSGFWANDPYNAFDGDLTTATGSGKTWDSSKGTLAADFGNVRTITKVVVHYQDNDDPNPGYKIEVSDDGQSWTTVKDVANPDLLDTQSDLNASGRFIRVVCKQFYFDPWWMHSVSEVEMWGMSDGQSH